MRFRKTPSSWEGIAGLLQLAAGCQPLMSQADLIQKTGTEGVGARPVMPEPSVRGFRFHRKAREGPPGTERVTARRRRLEAAICDPPGGAVKNSPQTKKVLDKLCVCRFGRRSWRLGCVRGTTNGAERKTGVAGNRLTWSSVRLQ